MTIYYIETCISEGVILYESPPPPPKLTYYELK